MKLIWKFNLAILAVAAVAFILAAVVSYTVLHANARDEVLQNARVMMESANASGDYTNAQVRPLLETQLKYKFIPQSVPAFAATEQFNELRKNYPDYTFKAATLNPTNPRNHATDWEIDIVNQFRQSAAKTEVIGERASQTGRSLYLARPIQIKDPACLTCHSTPDAAPRTMVETYGSANGFGWQKNEIIGAQIVSVPEALPVRMADQAFRSFVWSVGGVFLACLVLLDIALLFMVVRPLMRLSALADQISLGKFDVPEIPVRGSDEIATLSASFTRMRRSLERAMKLLE